MRRAENVGDPGSAVDCSARWLGQKRCGFVLACCCFRADCAEPVSLVFLCISQGLCLDS